MSDIDDDLDLFGKRVLAGGFLYKWSEGLGLEDPKARVKRMFAQAKASFLAHRASGLGLHESADIALGLTQDRRGDMTHVVREGVTPPAKVQGEL